MKNESVSALFTNKLDTLGADPRRRNWPRVLFMRWPRERGHVSLANFQVSDDIVGRSLGQIGGKERETERERVYITKIVHGEVRGTRVASAIPEDMPPPLLPERDSPGT